MLVLTADAVLARHLLSVVAALGLEADEASTDDLLRSAWRGAAAVLVGADQAARVAGLVLPSRTGVHVVGRDDERAETYAWASRLHAAAVLLPEAAPDLAAALAGLVSGDDRGRVLVLTGGSGGVGTSSLAAALALSAAADGRRVLLLDADPVGGGVDVLLGAEHLAGWRWSRFASARGHLGDLAGQLPRCDGVDVLAVDRTALESGALGEVQLAAVLDSAAASHDLVVVDLPRAAHPAHDVVLRRAATVLLVARADVRGVASADACLRGLAPRCRELEVVVRRGRGHRLDPEVVAETLDLPLAGVLEEDPALLAAAERGDPPGHPARSPLARLCRELCDRLVRTGELVA
ncbi:helicase/secretion neighborhood CpaE-like protein [Microlunatus flavus]|uniref:Helicase/secretion neighborhood CpaE-like protein n=1 Tax=Microlunatus flavus TaxID=1036181 RepID=A0A1H8ZIQ9_9ACTN|nr:helicase/secretion neighborhood CpaE-like protein [Microlunatus flavus]